MKICYKKIAVYLLVFIAVFIVFSELVFATEFDLHLVEEEINTLFDSDIRDSIEEYNIKAENGKIKNITIFIKEKIRDYYKKPLNLFISLSGMTLIISIFNQFNIENTYNRILNTIIVLGISSIVINPIFEIIDETVRTIISYKNFSVTFLPIFSGILTYMGQPITASNFNIFLFVVINIYTQVITELFVPFLYGYISLSIVSAIDKDAKISSLLKTLKSIFIWIISLSLTVLLGILSIQSSFSATSDGISAKTTKFIMGSFIPIIGSGLSDLYMASQGFVNIIKNFVGNYGILISLVTVLPSFTKLFLWYVFFKLTAFFSELFSVQQVKIVINSFTTVFEFLISVLVYILFLVMISITLILVCFKGV